MLILNFFFKIAPEIDLELCFKYLKYVLERIYETRSYNGKTIDIDLGNRFTISRLSNTSLIQL